MGHPNGTTLSLPPGCPDDYSLLIFWNAQLQQIDLSSLESIGGGGLLFLGNPELCFVGNLSMYLDDQATQPQCLGRTQPYRKDPQTCSECHNSHWCSYTLLKVNLEFCSVKKKEERTIRVGGAWDEEKAN